MKISLEHCEPLAYSPHMQTPSKAVTDEGKAPRDIIRNNFKQSFRVLKVEGQLWSGDDCSYEYSLNGPVTNLKEAGAIAGDFAFISHARIEITEREIRETIKTINFR